jgi:ABC-type amino acid transport substrate-binding protein
MPRLVPTDWRIHPTESFKGIKHMKSIHHSLLACACAALAAALSTAPALAQDARPTLARVAESSVLKIGHRESSIPFSYLDGTKPIGLAMDLCALIAQAVKTKVGKPEMRIEYTGVTSQNRIPLVANGTIDLECGSTTNNTQRREQVEFAINHFYTGTRLLVKKSSGIKGYAELQGKPVATTTGTTNFQVLRKFNADRNLGIDLVSGKDHVDSMLLVEMGRAVAFGMDDILLYGLITGAKDPAQWQVVGEALQVEPYAIMLRKNDPEFKKLVDDTLLAAIKSGEFEKLYKKWFQSPIPPRNISLDVPMSDELRQHLKTPTDKPAL